MTNYRTGTRRLFILCFLFVLSLCMGKELTSAQESIRFKTVVIDAGHGGRDPGAVGKNCKEKDIVLSVALKLGEYIHKYLPEVKVVYTRKTDMFVPLDRRAEIANENEADLFVSIHANYIGVSNIYGAETFVLGLHRTKENLEVAKKENAVITLEEDYTTKYEGFDPNSTESYIIFELMQNVYLDQSIHMASLVQDQFHHRVGRRDRGVKQAGFLVLRKTAMPGILVELGFISNRNEEKFMISEKGQSYLASALFRSVRDYKNEFEAKSQLLDEGVRVAKEQAVVDNKDISFRIQVASSKRELNEQARVLKSFNDIWMFKEGNRYKYTTGLASDYNEILSLMKEVKKVVADCFVVAFQNEKRIRVDEALKLLKN
ncbi:MAG: N-acetylmuramoyl-L-alanine amidase [Marinilabiliaceae bacterium]|nr:N-acetylmuramoyl-L-alanine amidase [Marinilabiliaceae bacterium]